VRVQDFTFVVYDSTSLLSLLLAYVTFAPIALLLVLLSSVVLRRDLEAAFQCAGLLLSTGVNTVLKRVFAQSRPVGSAKLGHGMPSDHAQFSFFFCVYAAVWIVHRCRMRRAYKGALIALMAVAVAVVCYSRIHLGVHTVEQVLAGSCAGAILGSLWALWAHKRVWKHHFPRMEASALGRFFSLKDGATVPDGCRSSQEFEYQCYIAHRAAARLRKERATAAGGLKDGHSVADDLSSGPARVGRAAVAVAPLLPHDKLN
jgi:membrane-associated phospholipid phosphatase